MGIPPPGGRRPFVAVALGPDDRSVASTRPPHAPDAPAATATATAKAGKPTTTELRANQPRTHCPPLLLIFFGLQRRVVIFVET